MQKLWLDGVYAKINRFQPIFPDFLLTQSLEISIFVLTNTILYPNFLDGFRAL